MYLLCAGYSPCLALLRLCGTFELTFPASSFLLMQSAQMQSILQDLAKIILLFEIFPNHSNTYENLYFLSTSLELGQEHGLKAVVVNGLHLAY